MSGNAAKILAKNGTVKASSSRYVNYGGPGTINSTMVGSTKTKILGDASGPVRYEVFDMKNGRRVASGFSDENGDWSVDNLSLDRFFTVRVYDNTGTYNGSVLDWVRPIDMTDNPEFYAISATTADAGTTVSTNDQVGWKFRVRSDKPVVCNRLRLLAADSQDESVFIQNEDESPVAFAAVVTGTPGVWTEVEVDEFTLEPGNTYFCSSITTAYPANRNVRSNDAVALNWRFEYIESVVLTFGEVSSANHYINCGFGYVAP